MNTKDALIRVQGHYLGKVKSSQPSLQPIWNSGPGQELVSPPHWVRCVSEAKENIIIKLVYKNPESKKEYFQCSELLITYKICLSYFLESCKTNQSEDGKLVLSVSTVAFIGCSSNAEVFLRFLVIWFNLIQFTLPNFPYIKITSMFLPMRRWQLKSKLKLLLFSGFTVVSFNWLCWFL